MAVIKFVQGVWFARQPPSAATASVTVVGGDAPRFGCRRAVARADQVGGRSRNPLASNSATDADERAALVVHPGSKLDVRAGFCIDLIVSRKVASTTVPQETVVLRAERSSRSRR